MKNVFLMMLILSFGPCVAYAAAPSGVNAAASTSNVPHVNSDPAPPNVMTLSEQNRPAADPSPSGSLISGAQAPFTPYAFPGYSSQPGMNNGNGH